MGTRNSYDNAKMAAAYAQLEFPGTYYLAYRDLPGIIAEHVRGTRALDFGCGTGRSTRFLRKLGFQAFGVDISEDMIKNARLLDPEGDYRLIEEGGVSGDVQKPSGSTLPVRPECGKRAARPENAVYRRTAATPSPRERKRGHSLPPLSQVSTCPVDLVLSAFTFDNIPTFDAKVAIMRDLGKLLSAEGRFISLVSSPEIYVNEWASFSTRDYPENRHARSGDRVKIIITAIEGGRMVEDTVCSDEDYRKLYAAADLGLIETFKPLGRPSEPQKWLNETRIAPWVIYVVGKSENVIEP